MSENKNEIPPFIGTPWNVYNDGSVFTHKLDYVGTLAAFDEQDRQHIVHCVNTYEEREALLKEMAEALKLAEIEICMLIRYDSKDIKSTAKILDENKAYQKIKSALTKANSFNHP